MSDVINFYKNILSFSGMSADEDGLININLLGAIREVTIDGRRLSLPLDQRLRNPGELAFFHPLSEFIIAGESEVNEVLRKCINMRLNTAVAGVMMALVRLASSPALHPGMTPTQSSILTPLKDADEKSLQTLQAIISKLIKKDAEKALLSVYVKRSGEIQGKRVARLGVVNFHFLDRLMSKDNEHIDNVEGVYLRKRKPIDSVILREAFKIIFPLSEPTYLNKENVYNKGSDYKIAPFLHATMQTSMELGRKINSIIELFEDYIDEADEIKFKAIDELEEVFQNEAELKKFSRLIPSLPYNEGRRKKENINNAPNTLDMHQLADISVSNMREKPTQDKNINPAVNPVVHPQPTTPSLNNTAPTLTSIYPNQPIQQPINQLMQNKQHNAKPTLSSILGGVPSALGVNTIMPMQQQRTPTWATPNAPINYNQQQLNPLNTAPVMGVFNV